MNSSIGKWIKSIIIIYQCFTHLKLLVQIQAELGDWLDGISKNPRYLNEDNFKSEVNFKSENQKNKKVFQQRQTAPHTYYTKQENLGFFPWGIFPGFVFSKSVCYTRLQTQRIYSGLRSYVTRQQISKKSKYMKRIGIDV